MEGIPSTLLSAILPPSRPLVSCTVDLQTGKTAIAIDTILNQKQQGEGEEKKLYCLYLRRHWSEAFDLCSTRDHRPKVSHLLSLVIVSVSQTCGG